MRMLASMILLPCLVSTGAADAAKPQERGTVAFVGKLVSIHEVRDTLMDLAVLAEALAKVPKKTDPRRH